MVRFTIIQIYSFIMMKHFIFTLCCFIYPADGFQFWGSTDILRGAGIVSVRSWCHILHTGSTQQLNTPQSGQQGRFESRFLQNSEPARTTSRLCFVLFIIRLWSCCCCSSWATNNQQKFSPGAQPSDGQHTSQSSVRTFDFLSTGENISVGINYLQFIIVQCDNVRLCQACDYKACMTASGGDLSLSAWEMVEQSRTRFPSLRLRCGGATCLTWAGLELSKATSTKVKSESGPRPARPPPARQSGVEKPTLALPCRPGQHRLFPCWRQGGAR